MQRFDRDRGLVLTDQALLFTPDGGATWVDVGPRRGLAGVSEAFFLEAHRGWLAGVTPGSPSRLVVLDTADGGSSWREQEVEASDLLGGRFYADAQLQFADTDHGWLLGRVATGAAVSVGELLATSDAGELAASTAAACRRPIQVREPGAGLHDRSAGPRALYRTLDAGRSWHELRFAIAAAPGRVLFDLPVFTTPQDGTLAVTVGGDQPRLVSFVTQDGGLTWQRARSLRTARRRLRGAGRGDTHGGRRRGGPLPGSVDRARHDRRPKHPLGRAPDGGTGTGSGRALGARTVGRLRRSRLGARGRGAL